MMSPEPGALMIQNVKMLVLRSSNDLVLPIIIQIGHLQAEETIWEVMRPFERKIRCEDKQVFCIGPDQDFYTLVVIDVGGEDSVDLAVFHEMLVQTTPPAIEQIEVMV